MGGLRRIVETYQLEIRLTANQDLLLCNIGTGQRAAIRAELAALGFEIPETPAPLARHAIACPALPTCGLAITESERVLPDVLDRLDAQLRRLEIEKSLLVRMTGCPNGCARPYMAELGLVGNGVNQYQLWLGGASVKKDIRNKKEKEGSKKKKKKKIVRNTIQKSNNI